MSFCRLAAGLVRDLSYMAAGYFLGLCSRQVYGPRPATPPHHQLPVRLRNSRVHLAFRAVRLNHVLLPAGCKAAPDFAPAPGRQVRRHSSICANFNEICFHFFFQCSDGVIFPILFPLYAVLMGVSLPCEPNLGWLCKTLVQILFTAIVIKLSLIPDGSILRHYSLDLKDIGGVTRGRKFDHFIFFANWRSPNTSAPIKAPTRTLAPTTTTRTR